MSPNHSGEKRPQIRKSQIALELRKPGRCVNQKFPDQKPLNHRTLEGLPQRSPRPRGLLSSLSRMSTPARPRVWGPSSPRMTRGSGYISPVAETRRLARSRTGPRTSCIASAAIWRIGRLGPGSTSSLKANSSRDDGTRAWADAMSSGTTRNGTSHSLAIVRPEPTYQVWADATGGLFDVVGLLKNREAIHSALDDENGVLRQLRQLWWVEHGGTPIPTSSVAALADAELVSEWGESESPSRFNMRVPAAVPHGTRPSTRHSSRIVQGDRGRKEPGEPVHTLEARPSLATDVGSC